MNDDRFNVEIDSRPWRADRVDVRAWIRAGKHVGFATVGENGEVSVEFREVSPFEVIEHAPVLLRCSRELLIAIAKELGGDALPHDATADALVDTRTVRDRLLSLVEKGWGRA